MKKTLVNDFPRTMGHPRQDKVVYNVKQRDEYVKKYMKRCDLYISVYRFTDIDEKGEVIRESAFIDKIFFDLDNDWYGDLFKIYDWCKKHQILSRSQFSGNGSQFFIYIAPTVVNKKEAVGNFQRWIQTEIDIEIDMKIIGDIARIFRYPNTYNFKGRRWCIPIPREALEKRVDKSWFYRHATKQQFNFNPWCGSKLLDISQFDVPELLYCEDIELGNNFVEISEEVKQGYSLFPPCVQQWLSNPSLSGHGKFLLVLFLKDQLYTPIPYDHTEIISILKNSLSDDEFHHYFGTRKMRRHQGHLGKKFKAVFKKDYYMPNCEEIKKKGFCPYNCGRRNPIYD